MRRSEYISFSQGLDLVTPSISLPPGALIGCQNYELERNGLGYERILGYERFDGQNSPSSANYWIVRFKQGSAGFVSGDTVIAGSAQGEVLIDAVLESGSYAAGDAAGYLVLVISKGLTADIIGITDGVSLIRFSDATVMGVAAGSEVKNGAGTDALHYTYQQAAIARLRSRIKAVPGSGPIRGIVQYNDSVYAFRDNAAGTACELYFSNTLAGWSKVDLGQYLAFDAGSQEIKVGDTVTGATSAASGEVTSVAITSGSWSSSDAAGRLYFSSITGTFQDNESLKVGATACATADNVNAAVTLLPGGRYEFVVHNFYASSGLLSFYGCDGKNPAFEFNGYFSQIFTGIANDTPNHIAVYKNRLFLGYRDGVMDYSVTGDPKNFSGLSGAGEIGLGGACTALEVSRGALICFTRNRTYQLTGSDSASWVLNVISDNTGALDWTVQSLSTPKFFDDRGLTSLNATAAFGNFDYATFSQKIEPWLQPQKSRIASSCIVKEKNQYRLFFSDKSCLSVTFSGEKVVGFATSFFNHVVRCVWSGENSGWYTDHVAGNEEIYFGSDEGWVFNLEKGTSFDGDEIEAFLNTAFYHYQTPQRRKRFFHLTLDGRAVLGADIKIIPTFSYGGDTVPQSRNIDISLPGIGGIWGANNWDSFVWGGAAAYNGQIYIDGIGENMGLFIYSKSATENPHTLHGVVVEYSFRGKVR